MDQLRQSKGRTVTRMRNVLLVLLAPTMLAFGAGVAPPTAGTPAVDKSVFNLFDPTPTEYLRAMDRDGPGATESPYTVDAGREPSVQRRREHRCNPLSGRLECVCWNDVAVLARW